MANYQRSPAENYDRPGPISSETSSWSAAGPASGKEFFAKWLHRKQEHELGRDLAERNSISAASSPATRFSRLLHRLESKPQGRDISLHANKAAIEGEMRFSHRDESISELGKQVNGEELDETKEAIFDTRHEQLDSALPPARPLAVSADGAADDEVQNSASQQPTPVSSILANQPYVRAKQTVSASGEPSANVVAIQAIKSFKAYILYGFLAGLAVIFIMAFFVI